MPRALRVLVALALLLSPALSRPAAAVPSVPVVPFAPVEEENEEEKAGEEANVKAVAPNRADRRVRLSAPVGAFFPPPPAAFARHAGLPCAARLDPFRNGLGTPFRC
jgi:hypothetical protein